MSANPYAPPQSDVDPAPRPGESTSLLPANGARLLTLAIVGLALGLAVGVGFVLGLSACVAARAELKQIAAGARDPAGEGLTRAALVCGAVASALGLAVLVLCVVLWTG